MILLSIFLILCLVEAIVIYFKWNEISDFVSISKVASKVVGYEKEFTGFIDKLVLFFVKRKEYIWIPISIVISVNFAIAMAVSFFIWLIQLIAILF